MDSGHSSLARGLTVVVSATGLTMALRRLARTWGATRGEATQRLPGDDLVPAADVVATRAISIAAPSSDVWPWLVQLGYGRGGFYSFDRLEQLAGLDIRSADRVVPEWQHLSVGDHVDLAEGFGLTVGALEPDRHLVLVGRDARPGGTAPPFDFSWAFVLQPGRSESGGTTRLVVRERYRPHGLAGRLMVEATVPVSCLMSAAMLRGIRDRAQAASVQAT